MPTGPTSESEQTLNELLKSQFPDGEPAGMNREVDDSIHTSTNPNPEQRMEVGEDTTISPVITYESDAPVDAMCIGFGSPDNAWCIPANSPTVTRSGDANSGSIRVDLEIPAQLCQQLGSTCHDLRRYEYARTASGTFSPPDINMLAIVCGSCDEPSCQRLIQQCVPSSNQTVDAQGAGGSDGSDTQPIADFDMKIPVSYFSAGPPAFFDEVEVTFQNRSRNATYYEWEINGEIFEGKTATFTHRFNMSEGYVHGITLRAYSHVGGFYDTHYKSLELPPLKNNTRVVVNGETRMVGQRLYYSVETPPNSGNAYIEIHNLDGPTYNGGWVQHLGIPLVDHTTYADKLVLNTIRFSGDGFFATNLPTPMHFQTNDSYCLTPDGAPAFYLGYSSGLNVSWKDSGINDPDGEYTKMVVDPISVVFSAPSDVSTPSDVFMHIVFETVEDWGGQPWTVELYTIPPASFYGK